MNDFAFVNDNEPEPNPLVAAKESTLFAPVSATVPPEFTPSVGDVMTPDDWVIPLFDESPTDDEPLTLPARVIEPFVDDSAMSVPETGAMTLRSPD